MEKSEWEKGERTSQDRSGRREERRGERNRQRKKEREERWEVGRAFLKSNAVNVHSTVTDA